MVDEFGHLLYKKGSLIHPLHDALLQNESYEKSQEYLRENPHRILCQYIP
jgi:hypothetical protein